MGDDHHIIRCQIATNKERVMDHQQRIRLHEISMHWSNNDIDCRVRRGINSSPPPSSSRAEVRHTTCSDALFNKKDQPTFTATSMCHSVSYVYAECNRSRSAALFACEAGYDRSSGCNAGQFTTHALRITAPSLCPNCYRATEAKICEEAKAKSDDIQETIEEAVADMHRANELHARVLAICTDNEELTMQEIRIHTRRIEELDDIIVGQQVSSSSELRQARTFLFFLY